MSEELKLVIDAKAICGEGPCWDEEKQLLYWVDIGGKKVHIYNPATNENRSIDVGQAVGAIVLRKSGGAVVALENGFYFLDLDTGALTLVNDPESHLPQNRFNDGKCDPAGRFWTGTMPKGGSEPSGSLYCLDTDLSVRKIFEGARCSNGLAWSPDYKTMYYIDSPTKEVVAFDYDLDTGHISNKRTVVTIPKDGGVPDGMTIDTEGMIWVAQWGGCQVARWNPHTGEMLQAIPVPAIQVSSCAFGGPNMDELYITTARGGMKEDALAKYPHAGGVFKIKTSVQGMPSYKFGG